MSTVAKLSVSLPSEQVKWARKRARAQGASFSALLSEIIAEKREHEQALVAFEKYFGETGRVTPSQARLLRHEWKGA